MASVADPGLSALVEGQIRELLSDASFRLQNGVGGGIGKSDKDRLDWVEGRMSTMLADGSLGGIGNTGYWFNGASIINSTVSADKITVNTVEAINIQTGNLNVTGNLTAAASYPAVTDRIVLNSTGLYGYQSDGVSTTFRLNVDGSGEIGPNAGVKISWDATGAIVVPTATISSLLISDIGGGVLGGTYQTAVGTTRIDLSTTGIFVYSAGVETMSMTSATGAISIVGSFTVQSSATGARVVIDSAGGIEGKNAADTTTFLLNASTGAGQLGSGAISWDNLGAVVVAGASITDGTVTAAKITASTLESITTNTGNLNVGGTFVAAAAYPATTGERIAINAGGLYGYNSVDAVTFQLQVSGAGQLGTGTVSWTSAGVVTIDGGVVSNGTILAAALNVTSLDAVTTNTGGLNVTGNFTAAAAYPATSGARVVINAGGVAGYNAADALTFSLLVDGSGQLGTGAVAWTDAGVVTVNGSAVGTGISGTNVTTGTLDASVVTVSNINAGNITTGSMAASYLATGALTSTIITLGSGGAIVDADGSTWEQGGITLVSGGAFGDCIQWENASTIKGSITVADTFWIGSNNTPVMVAYSSVSGASFDSTQAQIYSVSGAEAVTLDSGGVDIKAGSLSSVFNTSGDLTAYRRIYPGNQATRYILDSGAHLGIAGSSIGGSASNWSAGSPTGAAYVILSINGTLCRVPFWANG